MTAKVPGIRGCRLKAINGSLACIGALPTARHIHRSVVSAIVVIAMAGMSACAPRGDASTSQPAGVHLEHVTSSGQVPYSEIPGLAIMDSNSVCLFDSYRVEILCGDRGWRNVTTVAREGSGPGEVGRSGRLLSAPRGGVAFLDVVNARITFFTSNREFAESVRIRRGSPASDVLSDSTIVMFGQPAPATEPSQHVYRVDAGSGEVIETARIAFEPGLIGRDTAILTDGLIARDGRMLVRISSRGDSYLAWYAPDGRFVEMLEFPSREPVYPTERDIEEFAAGYRTIFRTAPPKADIDEYARKPMGRLPRGAAYRTMQIDATGLAWVLSTRHGERGSSLDVFESSRHLGAIEIAGRVVGFQIADSLLIALVDAVEQGVDGLYPRRLDWYRIVHTNATGEASIR